MAKQAVQRTVTRTASTKSVSQELEALRAETQRLAGNIRNTRLLMIDINKLLVVLKELEEKQPD